MQPLIPLPPIDDQNVSRSNDDALSPYTAMNIIYKSEIPQIIANNNIIQFQAQRSSLSLQKFQRRSLISIKAKKKAIKARRKTLSSLKRKKYGSSCPIEKWILNDDMDAQTMDPSIQHNSSSSNMVVQLQIEPPDIVLQLGTDFSIVINGNCSSSDSVSSIAAHRPLISATFGKTSKFTIPLPLSKISSSEAQDNHITMLQPFESVTYLEGLW
ncbi:hypothetical protein FRX31_011642 [Thalictrum thalictroides]|uniref:Uncharacterized protein n=1 Tax=Thalictrum thalictroides TaxID=46969 RepID=A0A7J6WRM6_THATH|nr:hypothetical protein FRX31_011642 [Thalictrum thalictroides]